MQHGLQQNSSLAEGNVYLTLPPLHHCCLIHDPHTVHLCWKCHMCSKHIVCRSEGTEVDILLII